VKKTTAALAIAALAAPAAAQADRPDNDGTKNASERQQRNEQRQQQRPDHKRSEHKKGKRSKGVGFVVSGLVKGTAPTFAKAPAPTAPTTAKASRHTPAPAFTFGAAPSLDVTAANKHARKALGLTREQIKSDQALALSKLTTDDQFKLRFVGLTDANGDGTADEGLKDGDRVVIIGKVVRTKKPKTAKTTATASRHHGDSRFEYGAVDVRKVIVARPGTEAPKQDD
jgi:hypothetical protein